MNNKSRSREAEGSWAWSGAILGGRRLVAPHMITVPADSRMKLFHGSASVKIATEQYKKQARRAPRLEGEMSHIR